MLQYDTENRLTQVAVSGSVTTTYAYNADGARVKRAMGSTTTYYIGNWYEVTQAGAVTKYYYFGGKRVAVRQSGTLYYLHTDHLGSTSVTSNASGAHHHQTRQVCANLTGLFTQQRVHPRRRRFQPMAAWLKQKPALEKWLAFTEHSLLGYAGVVLAVVVGSETG